MTLTVLSRQGGPVYGYSIPEEVAGLVGYLASDTAASITAQALNICGGLGNFRPGPRSTARRGPDHDDP